MIPKCSKCFSKCHAECCTWVDLDIEWVSKNRDKIQRNVYGYIESEIPGKAKFVTNMELDSDGKIDNLKQTCPFLTSEYKCAVYKERPFICRVFGTETPEDHPFTCHYHLGKPYHFPPHWGKDISCLHTIKYYDSILKKYPNIAKEL